MGYRKIEESDLVGKTIKAIDSSAVNMIEITFTDNSVLELWAEFQGMIGALGIPSILVNNSNVE